MQIYQADYNKRHSDNLQVSDKFFRVQDSHSNCQQHSQYYPDCIVETQVYAVQRQGGSGKEEFMADNEYKLPSPD
jgi:hypothetical protein